MNVSVLTEEEAPDEVVIRMSFGELEALYWLCRFAESGHEHIGDLDAAGEAADIRRQAFETLKLFGHLDGVTR